MSEDDARKDYLLKEVVVIQDTIRRMSGNTFLIKGWTITLVTAALLVKGSRSGAVVAFVPILLFWYLDAYYLRQERRYRRLYEWVVGNRLQSDEHLLDLDASRFDNDVASVSKIMLSGTTLLFYAAVALMAVLFLLLFPKVGFYL